MKTKENSNLRKNLKVYLEEIKIKYEVENKTQDQIAVEYGVSKPTLVRFLKEHGINKGKRRDLNDLKVQKEIINEVEALLASGSTLTNALHAVKINHDKYALFTGKKSISNDIDSDKISLSDADFCYWLGLFIADGHMDKNTIWVSQSNASFLKKIQKLFRHEGNLNSVNAEKRCFKLVFTNKKLRNFLEQYSIDSNKKLTAPYINCGENEHHFIRGLFDGDGCIYYAYVSGKFTEKSISITTGSELVKNGVVNFLIKNNIDHSVRKETAVNDYYKICIEKFDDIFKFANIIYKDKKQAFLERKYYNFIKLKQLHIMNCKVNDIVDSSSNVDE